MRHITSLVCALLLSSCASYCLPHARCIDTGGFGGVVVSPDGLLVETHVGDDAFVQIDGVGQQCFAPAASASIVRILSLSVGGDYLKSVDLPDEFGISAGDGIRLSSGGMSFATAVAGDVPAGGPPPRSSVWFRILPDLSVRPPLVLGQKVKANQWLISDTVVWLEICGSWGEGVMLPGTPYEEALPDDGCRLVSIDNDDNIQWVKRHSGKIGAVTVNGTQVRAFVGDARQLQFGALLAPGQGTKHAFWVDLDADGQEASIHLVGTGTGDLNVNSVLEVPGTGWMMSVEIDGTASIPLAGGGTAELRGGYTPHLVLFDATLEVTSVASPVLSSTGGALLLRRFINGSVHATGLTLRGTGYVDGPFVSPPATGGTGVYYVRFSPQGAMEEVREFSGGQENRRVRDVKVLDDGTIVVSGKYETGAQCDCCTPRQELLLEKIPDITVMEGGFLSAWTPAGALQWELRHHAIPKDDVETACQ